MPQAKVTIKGHPVHPAMTAFAIGLLTGAVLADSAYLLGGHSPFWLSVSFWASVAGIIAGLAAAVPGIIDYLYVARHTSANTIAVVHMTCNVIALTLFGTGTFLMYGHTDRMTIYTAIVIQFVAFIFMGIGGFLGGELAFRHKIGVVDGKELPVEQTLTSSRL